ncbi:coiled-coil domain-containing protein 84-like isoform X1 [Stegodyphus dumicola]|uniref:coiled-coil domain-containing protein 84-like isoform X1 n=1 Tax=Stegodyphus dumicola TaxID=202533 RepID=UPI0015A82FA5|nr:coiled-coil domain-containing protein 84-like isoform X1 [Stegodyphus dumicola]
MEKFTEHRRSEVMPYRYCGFCLNGKNILNSGHRRSKDHQKKLKQGFLMFRRQIRNLKSEPVKVHDEQWEKRNEFERCNFCQCKVLKHQAHETFIIESLNFLSHLAGNQHAIAVKKFLKDNMRKENFVEFCIKKEELNSFMDKIPAAESDYLKKMDNLHKKHVRQIKEAEMKRQKLMEESVQTSVLGDKCLTEEDNSQIPLTKCSGILKPNKNTEHAIDKIPPWLQGRPDTEEMPSCSTVIGPTMDTYLKHVSDQKKKTLPANRIGAKFKHDVKRSSRWLPFFGGVWNQGRHNRYKKHNQ